jgi:hypothetical protein
LLGLLLGVVDTNIINLLLKDTCYLGFGLNIKVI